MPIDKTLETIDLSLLPKLLFVTSRHRLAQNVGEENAAILLKFLHENKLEIYVDENEYLDDPGILMPEISRILNHEAGYKGVVLIGGYDVVPSQKLDCLPTDLRRELASNADWDDFFVWSDDVYGDMDGDGLPEVPVSRIPDCYSAEILITALNSKPSAENSSRFGIRNVARPFADEVFDLIAGNGNLLLSEPTVFDQEPPFSASADRLYFMLHGHYADASRFWGEGTPVQPEAFNVNNIPDRIPGVVFSGCCWGALSVNRPAVLVNDYKTVRQRRPDESIALGFLSHGASSFVGCTGLHYSPVVAPYGYAGGPMHRAFWENIGGGMSSAEALFLAKVQYIEGMPYGDATAAEQLAIEYKILRQYTCLGLSW